MGDRGGRLADPAAGLIYIFRQHPFTLTHSPWLIHPSVPFSCSFLSVLVNYLLSKLELRECAKHGTLCPFFSLPKDPGRPHALLSFRFLSASLPQSLASERCPLLSFEIGVAPGSAEVGAADSVWGVCPRWGWRGLAVWQSRAGREHRFMCGLVLPTPTHVPRLSPPWRPRQQSQPSCCRICFAETALLSGLRYRQRNSTWGWRCSGAGAAGPAF